MRRLLCAVMLTCLAQGVLAQPRPFTVALLDSRPYAWLDEKGQPQGLYPEIIAALFREAGQEWTVSVVPFARAASMVVNGTADVTMMFATAQTDGKAQQAAVVFNTQQVVQMRPGLDVRDRTDLAHLQIGRLIGGCQELADTTLVRWRFQDLASQESGVRMLALGRIDGFCTANEALEDVLTSTALATQLAQAKRIVLSTKPVWLLLKPSMAQTQRYILVQALQRVQKSGEMARIFTRHLGSAYVLSLPKH